jgi:hypothetical protein
MKIKRHLNAIDPSAHKSIDMSIYNKQWNLGGQGKDSTFKFFGTVLEKHETDFFLNALSPFIDEFIKENNITDKIMLQRSHINCNPAYHPGDWHIDWPNGFTVLYFPIPESDFGDEGGTDFEGHGYEPYIPNSVLIFPGYIKHVACQHTKVGIFRFSIAFKFIIGDK